jgi:hypothetical protein
MSFNVTSLRDIVKPLQYAGEGDTGSAAGTATNYGVTPTSPTFIPAGINIEIATDPNVVSEQIRALGVEDYADEVKTQERYAFSLSSNMLNTDLMKFGVNALGTTGTANESLTFTFSKYINGTENYTTMNGARPISTSATVALGLWRLDMIFDCQEILDETTSGIAGATYITAIPTGTPLSHVDQADPFSWNSVIYPERSFNITVTRNLSRLDSNGNVLSLYTKAADRNITWSTETYKKSSAIQTDYYEQTPRTMTYKIEPSETMTFTNALLTEYAESYSATDTDAAIERLTGSARGVTIA